MGVFHQTNGTSWLLASLQAIYSLSRSLTSDDFASIPFDYKRLDT